MAVSARNLVRVRVPGAGLVATRSIEPLMPFVVTAAVVVGLAIAFAMTPIGSGDYGQWLMTSRYFLGESVPAYRNMAEVPPLAPFLLAAVRSIVPDPFVSLHVMATVLLFGLAASLALAGSRTIRHPWAGPLAVVIGLLVTDRFTDLFAFGALLQIAAVTLLIVAVAAFIRAGSDPASRRWWWIGTAALGAVAVAHVGTGVIAVPAVLIVAGVAAVEALVGAGGDVQAVVSRLRWPALGLAIIALYWTAILLPASDTYITNPASLAYRGPDRLFEDLFGRWPTTAVIVVGAASIVFGAIRAFAMRRIDGYVALAAWATVTWGTLAYSILRDSATDYPRFSTLLLAPLVVGAAGGVLWILTSFATSVADLGWRRPAQLVVSIAVVGAVIVTAPLTIDRHMRQAAFYDLRDASSLTAAAAWLDQELPAGQAVLSEVRDGKWIEGLTGHAALFSQPVRYSFRPDEWQRSAEADALLRSTGMITSGYVSAQYTGAVDAGTDAVPTRLLIRANHGGEFLDLLSVTPAATQLTHGRTEITAAGLRPLRVREIASDRQATIRTVWTRTNHPRFSFTQTVTAYIEGTTLRVTQDAPGWRISTLLTPVAGMTATSVDINGSSALMCFTEIAGASPCVRIDATDPRSRLRADAEGGLLVTGPKNGELDLLVTALTSGGASVGLGILDPAVVADANDVGAAILNQLDPAYAGRRARLQRIGFVESRSFGPYRVLLREPGGG